MEKKKRGVGGGGEVCAVRRPGGKLGCACCSLGFMFLSRIDPVYFPKGRAISDELKRLGQQEATSDSVHSELHQIYQGSQMGSLCCLSWARCSAFHKM